jgi:FkbM family methyltransferase
MKKIINRIIKKVFSGLGYNLEKKQDKSVLGFEKDYLLFNFYSTLQAFQFEPKHIVDVGANHGTWTRQALKYFPKAHYTMVEPQDWLKPSIQDVLDKNPNVKFHSVGAGEKEGSFLFTILDRDDSCSFKFTEEEAKSKGYKQVEIPVVTLNGLLSNKDILVPDIIKIDAEGLDIEVLKGASDFFGKTEIFMVEAGVVNKMFTNSFLKLINFMDENGYRLFEITDLNRPFKPSVLWLVELVFVRKGGIIDSKEIYNG